MVSPAELALAVDTFEDAVASAHDVATMQAFELLMRKLEDRATGLGPDGLFDTQLLALQNATRVAAAISAWVARPAFDMDQQRYTLFCVFSRFLVSIFTVSGLTGTRALRARIARQAEAHGEASATRKRWALTFLCDCDEDTLKQAESLDPELLRPWWFGLMSYRVVMDAVSHQARETLLGWGERLGDAALDPALETPLVGAWMLCSYAERADKHLVKGTLNGLLRQDLVSPTLLASPPRSKPRIAIVAEQFRSNHAMFRCWADGVRQLRGRADTLLVAPHDAVDTTAVALFDRHLHFDPRLSMSEVAAAVAAEQPDLVLFLSVGMSKWSVPLSTLRMAPVQVLAPGHPATAVNDAFDYMLTTEDYAQFGHCYGERQLILADGILDMHEPPGTRLSPQPVREVASPLRIAVPSATIKIGWPFLQACADIQTRAQRPLEWHFFPYMVGVGLVEQAIRIHSVLNNATLHPSLSYNEYLQRLARCDLSLGTFPFGGSNSNVDLLRLGIPKVWFSGDEMHSRSDRAVFGGLGIDGFCEARDVAGYVAQATRLIDNDELRVTLANHLREHPAASGMMAGQRPLRRDFADALLWVCAHHAEIVAADQWTVRAGRLPDQVGAANEQNEETA